MGASREIVCHTCKVEYYLGYGSHANADAAYKRWHDTYDSQHEGHDLHEFSSCYTDKHNGHLYPCLYFCDPATTEPIIRDYASYAKVHVQGFCGCYAGYGCQKDAPQ